jgi:hypothetical protein
MSQHDMVIDDGPGLAVRTDFNAAIQALASVSLGPVEPQTMYEGQLWLDTSVPPNGVLRQRDLSNAAWIVPVFPPATLPGAVRADIAQAFTPAEQMQARTNISAIGNLFKRTIITLNGTHIFDTQTKYVLVEVVGGGGSGAGLAAGTAGQCGAGAGGAGGGYTQKFFAKGALLSGAVTIGAGGAASNTNGNPGFQSKWDDGVNLLTAEGGAGGATSGLPTSLTALPGSLGGAAAGGNLVVPGAPSEPMLALGTALLGAQRMAVAGNGASTLFGAGGRGAATSQSTGLAAYMAGGASQGFGAGGAGASLVNTGAASAGSAGRPGVVIVWEFR